MDEQQREKLSQVQKLRRGAVIIEQTQDQFRQDGYSNLLNKYGTVQDNSMAYSYEQEPVISDLELIRLYEGNGLFAKIIDRPSEESVKHGFDIDYGDEDIAEYVDDRLDELEFEDKFATAEKWARLYGGAIIVMLCDDGGGLEEPLDWNKVTTIEEMRVFERAIVQEDYTSLYHFHFFDSMKNKKPFGQPEYYHVYSTYGYFTVHYSRCLIFRNGRLPEQTTNSIYRYWGMPEYVKINRALRECITSHEDGVKLLERSVQAIYKMKNLAQLLSTDSGEDKVLQRLQVIDMARGILNSIAIDTDGEDYDYKSLPLSGVKDVIDSTCNMLSAVTNIPQTILFGRSPAGMNATGESDLENYYNMVENIQKQNMKANARTVIDLILKQGLIEGKIPEIPKYKMKFAALWSMSEMEKADADQKKAQTEQVKAQTAQVYIESGVLDPSEVRKSLANEGDFDIEEVISEDDLNLPDDTFAPKEVPEEKETDDFDLGIKSEVMNSDGGSGSGNWGHSGRPGKRGGSAGGGGKAYRQGTKESGFSSEAKKRAAEKKKATGVGGAGGSGTGNGNSSGSSKKGSEEKPQGNGVDVKSISKINRSQEMLEWANAEEDDRLAYLDDAKKDYPDYGFTRNGTLANAIASEEKLNSRPTSLSEKEFDEYVSQTGCQKIYRGVQNLVDDDGEILVTGAEIRKEFSSSDDSVYGGGNYGSGYHFSDSESYAKGFAREGEGGEVLECAVKPGAYIMQHSTWEKLPNSVKAQYDNDEGLFALTHGYDGITSNNGVTNILNRGSLVYKKPGQKKDNRDSCEPTASAIIIIDEGKILCASRRNNEGICGPGGHIEKGETPEDAALREAQEEFDIVPLNILPVGVYKGSTGSYCDTMVYFTDKFTGTPKADGGEMLNERWLSLEELNGKFLYPPFEESVKMLTNLLTSDDGYYNVTSEDGGPGSGRYPKGSRGNSSGSPAPDKSSQKFNFKRTGNSMRVTKDVKFRSGARIPSGSKITKIVDFAGGKSGKPVKVEEHLIKQHGGSKGSWTHSRGQTTVVKPNGKKQVCEVHWFESPGVGQIGMKIKRNLRGE